MTTVLDVFDNFLGERDCRLAARLSPVEWQNLTEELQRFYSAWAAPEPVGTTVFSGSWVAHNASAEVGRTVLGNDLLLFDRVVVHDPIEPFVSTSSLWTPPRWAPAAGPNDLTLAFVETPAAQSGRPPKMHTALYPPAVRSFLTVGEAMEFQKRDPSGGPIGRALAALEEWRELITAGAIVLVPVVTVTALNGALIARSAERSINRVAATIDALGGLELTSFQSRGLRPTAQFATTPQRDHARHVSWVYAREAAIAAEVGALYATEREVDSALLGALLHHEVPLVGAALSAASYIDLPGLRDVPLGDIARVRREVETFDALRRKLSAMILSSPADLDALSPVLRDAYVRAHVGDEIAAIVRDTSAMSTSIAARLFGSLLTLGVPLAVAAAKGDGAEFRVAATAAAATLVGQWIGRTRPSGEQKARLWIARHLSSEDGDG